jgi:cytochrome c oxidase subunit 2
LSRRTIPLAALAALLTLALAAAPAHAIPLSPPDPHSPNAETIHSTYWVTFVLVCLLIGAINAALIVAVVRFRERRGRQPARFAAGRGALRPVIAGLAVFALAVFVYGVVRTNDTRQLESAGPNGLSASPTAQVGIKGLPPLSIAEAEQSASGEEPASGQEPTETSPLEIDAIAQQWVWRFEYPGGTPGHRTFTYGELVVPIDTPVVLNITSTDVLHSWWLPELGGQVQATPGETVQTWFKADEVGVYSGRSTIFSGTSFPAMRASVRAVTVPEYTAYVEQLSKDLTAAQGIIAEDQRRSDAAAAAAAGAGSGE